MNISNAFTEMDVTSTRPPPVPHSQPEWWLILVNAFNGLILLLSRFSQAARSNLAWLFRLIFAWAPRLPKKTPNFDTLPPELVARILAKLNCQDILTIRRCSRRLLTISKARSVWENAIRHHLAERPWLPKPEEPLHAYSSPELEQWVASRTRAQHGWNAASPPRYRQMRQGKSSSILLIPGGRWLLTDPANGVVAVHDLDTPEMESKILISPVDDHDTEYGCIMAISMNDESPVLSFDIALVSMPYGGFPGREAGPRLSIWRVTLSGHGRDAELTALRITSFDIPTDRYPHFMSLDGEYLIQIKECRIEILKWTESTSSAHMMAAIYSNEQPEWVGFLPGGRVLSFSDSSMVVYDIPPLRVVPASFNFPFVAYAPHAWRVPCRPRNLGIGGISPIWIDGDTANFTMLTEDDVQAVTIPISADQPPLLTKLGLHQYGRRRFLLGFHNSVIHNYSSITALTHRWVRGRNLEVDDGIANTTARLCSTLSGHKVFGNTAPCLDEASARLVLVTQLNRSHVRMFLVVDLAEMMPHELADLTPRLRSRSTT